MKLSKSSHRLVKPVVVQGKDHFFANCVAGLLDTRSFQAKLFLVLDQYFRSACLFSHGCRFTDFSGPMFEAGAPVRRKISLSILTNIYHDANIFATANYM
jgi:hypothetical protein